MFESPKDGEIIIVRCKSGGVYLSYWGEIDGQSGWCDIDGGFCCEEADCVGWIPAPAIENAGTRHHER
jgi:hypothetical protein